MVFQTYLHDSSDPIGQQENIKFSDFECTLSTISTMSHVLICLARTIYALIILSKSLHFTFEVGFELNTHEFAASTMGIYPHSARSTLFKVVASISCSQKSCVCLKVPEILFRCCICCIYSCVLGN